MTCLSLHWDWKNLFPKCWNWPVSFLSFSEDCVTHSLPKMVKLDIHTLAHHLKQERLYVNSEKQLIQRLNADVLKTAEKLYRTAWISKQQRINLDRLIITRWLGGLGWSWAERAPKLQWSAADPSDYSHLVPGVLCCTNNANSKVLKQILTRESDSPEAFLLAS